jgi:hypothetical protein
MKVIKFIKPLLMLSAIFAVALFSFTSYQSEKPFGGLALYTVRDAMTKEARATLEKVAQAGYVNIESAGYNNGKFYNLSPADFKSLLAEMKLTPISAHQGSANFENIDQQIADLKTAGFKYFVIPVPPMGLFGFDNVNKRMTMKLVALKMLLNHERPMCAEKITELLTKCEDCKGEIE